MSGIRPLGLLTSALCASALVLGSACGGGSRASVAPASKTKPADGAATATTAAPDTGADASSPSASAPSHGRTATTAPAKGGQASGSAAGQPPGGRPSLPIEVSLASACVRPGTPQTITITAKPQAGVAYNAIYADGNNARDNRGNFYGGNKGDKTDGTGVWRDSWVVSVNAAPGPVHVDVVGMSMQGEAGYTTAGFAVARPDGSCS